MPDDRTLMWIPCCSGDPLPRGAVYVGTDQEGVGLYAGRAFHEGCLLPAKINTANASATVCWEGEECGIDEYEVLCFASVAWQSVLGHVIPLNAVVMGTTSEGEKLYIGRTIHDGKLILDKIQTSHKTRYIPFNGEEMTIQEFEIMVFRSPETHQTLTWIPCRPGDPLPQGAVHVGTDKGGARLYAGRAFNEGNLLPAKISATDALAASVCWEGEERGIDEFEVLCFARVAWQNVVGHVIPLNAVVMGITSEGEKLYMGRTFHDESLIPGEIQPRQGTLSIPYNGEEVVVKDYEIMVFRPPETL